MTLFDMLLVVPPPPHTCQSELRITHRVGAVAAVNRATSRLPAVTQRVCGGRDLIYSGSSPCMLSVRTEHDMSHRLAGKIWKTKKKKRNLYQQAMCHFQLGNKRNRTWELIFDGAKLRHNELYLRRSNLQSTVWQVFVELWIFRTSDGGSLLWLSSAACADTSKSRGGMILVLSTHQKS